jgi:phosphomannomutase
VASGEINSEVHDQAGVTARVREEFAAGPGVTTDELDGMTVSGEGWWFNLRPSNTEPLLRLNLEAADDLTMTRLRDDVLSVVRAHPSQTQPQETQPQETQPQETQ